MPNLTREQFGSLVDAARVQHASARLVLPVVTTLLADQLTPVVAYRRLVSPDPRTAPSFLLESVEGGERQGRYSILGARPAFEVVAQGSRIERVQLVGPAPAAPAGQPGTATDPFAIMRDEARRRVLVATPGTPACFLGGWVGYAAYDSVRYAEPDKLSFASAPRDDRNLPDLHFGFYTSLVIFDHAQRAVHVVELAQVSPRDDASEIYTRTQSAIDRTITLLNTHTEPLRACEMPQRSAVASPLPSNLSREQHATMLARAKEYIAAGDIFQVVLGQRFERESTADPFDVYRALRAVNPSPYMAYLQARGCILVASSPEILCRVRRSNAGLEVTNRPLAGTRRRGKDAGEDAALERELLADAKERAEHIMLVDLGRNDVGVVSRPGSVALPAVMEVERYSHVMHISSTVTGQLREGLDCWDALRAALPVGTISGAPKIRAMQIIDELEPIRRGPYGGGLGYVGLDGQMDIALTLRTIVAPVPARSAAAPSRWTYHLQASGGIVADSVAEDEYAETVNKAAALARAVEVAERSFV
jgi:anthranilate synthase component 1